MSYIFLDESGDLGFDLSKRRTSRYFMVTALSTEAKRPIEKIVAKTHAELKKKHQKRGGILHCVHEKPITRHRLLKRLIATDCTLMIIYLDKKRVYTNMKDEKTVLYNYVVNILLDRIFARRLVAFDKSITVIAERKETNRFLNENFKNYLSDTARAYRTIDFKVFIKTPFEEKALQAVDFASWALFRKIEDSDESYYQIIKQNIVEEMPLFP